MKAFTLLLSAGLASAQVLNNGLNLGVDALLNGSFDSSAASFDPAALGLNLGNLNVDGLDINNLDLNNQDSMVQAIEALLGNLCLNNALPVNNILGLGLNNQLDLFLQLAQLQQLQQLGFLGFNGINNLFNSGFALGGGFNVGVFKREVAKAKKSLKRFKLRRGTKVTKRQCQQVNQNVNQGVNNVNAVADGTVTIATAPAVASSAATAARVVASAPPVAIATAPAVAVATPAAVASAAPVASVAPVAVAPAPAPAAAVPAQPAASVDPAAAPAAAPGGEENLADFTR